MSKPENLFVHAKLLRIFLIINKHIVPFSKNLTETLTGRKNIRVFKFGTNSKFKRLTWVLKVRGISLMRIKFGIYFACVCESRCAIIAKSHGHFKNVL